MVQSDEIENTMTSMVAPGSEGTVGAERIISDRLVSEEAGALAILAKTKSPNENHSLWACEDSRALHLDVWRLRPSKEVVKTVVIAALDDALRMVQKMIESSGGGELQLHARNISLRRINLMRYADGLPSLLNPLATLKGDKPLGLLNESEFASYCRQHSLDIPLETYRDLATSVTPLTEPSAGSTPAAR